MLLYFEYSNQPYIYSSLCDTEGVSGQRELTIDTNYQLTITNPSSKYPVVDKLVLNA